MFKSVPWYVHQQGSVRVSQSVSMSKTQGMVENQALSK